MTINDEDIINVLWPPGKQKLLGRYVGNIKYSEYINYLENRFIDTKDIEEALYRIKYSIEHPPICPICGHSIEYNKKLHVYNAYCSKQCANKNPELIKHRKQTFLEKYGYEVPQKYGLCVRPKKVRIKQYVSKTEAVQKLKQTKLERYGDPNYCNVEKMKATKLQRYGNPGYNNIEKIKQTNIERYGGVSSMCSPQVREKSRNTCLKNHGCEYYVTTTDARSKNTCSLPVARQKAVRTSKERYGDDNYNNRVKYAQTCLTKYGVEHYSMSDNFKTKMSIAASSDEFQQKRNNTLKSNKSYNKSKDEDLIYNMLLQKYGCVERNYASKLYPFKCDFYIPSEDLYIEYNGSHYHHFHFYDSTNEDDIKELNRLESLRSKTNKKNQYDNIIYTWCDLDVRKQEIVKLNKLNFMVFWNVKEFSKWFEMN